MYLIQKPQKFLRHEIAFENLSLWLKVVIDSRKIALQVALRIPNLKTLRLFEQIVYLNIYFTSFVALIAAYTRYFYPKNVISLYVVYSMEAKLNFFL